MLLSTRRAHGVRRGLLPGCRPGGTRRVGRLGTAWCCRTCCPPRAPCKQCRSCPAPALPPLPAAGGAPCRRTWGKMGGMGKVRSAARRAEEQEGVPGRDSGSVRLLGGVTARSSLLWLVLTAGVKGPQAMPGSPYLNSPKCWVTHSPFEAQGRWKLRPQPGSAQVMLAPGLPQTKQSWKEQSISHQQQVKGLRSGPRTSVQGTGWGQGWVALCRAAW